MGLAEPFVAAAVQMDVRLGDPDANLGRVRERLSDAADAGARLVVFPECALSGYCFASAQDALPYAIPRTDARLRAFDAECSRLGVVGVLGFLELDGAALRNSAYIAQPDASPTVYRKTHLPTLGVDRFVSPGVTLDVTPTAVGLLGTLICYDARFPEAARCLALDGADVIALPTNWPTGGQSAPEYVLRARARENVVYIVAANRVGVERGRRFIGLSQIVGPDGCMLAQAGEDEAILYATVSVACARRKRLVFEPGEWEQDTVGDRRPSLYGALTR
jgi:predicted amidohydrolase